jgi:hypothetical protein
MALRTKLPLVTLVSAMSLWTTAAQLVAAERRAAANDSVQTAAFNGSVSPPQRQSVRFGRRTPYVGDQTDQSIALEMRLTLNMRRGNELVGKNQTAIRTKQGRIITTTAVDAGITRAASVAYPESTKQIIGAPDAAAPATPNASNEIVESPPVAQPVQGKTYHCQREPGDRGKLIVTDATGNPPPEHEREIVAQQMDMVGRPNPFAQFLAGRNVAVGDRLEVPKELAQEVFNLSDKLGEVSRFTLTLQNVQSEHGVNCAVFLANVEATSSDASQMRLEVEGPLAVEIDTCRATRAGLIGPIGMSEMRGSYSTAYQVIGTGRLQMSVTSSYREAGR